MTQQPGSPGWPGTPPPAGNHQPPTQGGWPPPLTPGRYPDAPGHYPAQPGPGAPGQYPAQPVPGASPPTGQGPGQQRPAAQQPAAGYRPTGQPDGRDPRQSFGEPPPTPVHIESFAPPKSSLGKTITIAGIALLVLIVVGGLFFRSAQPLPTPSPSPTVVAPPSSAQPGQPFETPDGQANGRWEIVGSHWTGEGLSVHVKITADNGPLTYGFLAFANQSAEVVEPEVGPDQPPLLRGTLRDDQSIDGWVFFATDRGDVTVILTTMGGKQMSALTVKG